MKILFNYFLCAFLMSATHIHAQNIFDLEHSLKFSEFLLQTGQYQYASRELERILLYERNAFTESNLLLSYRLSDQSILGWRRFLELYPNIKPANVKVQIEAKKLALLNKQWDFIDQLDSEDQIFDNMCLHMRLIHSSTWRTIRQGSNIGFPLTENPAHTMFYHQLENLYQEKWKSPVLAAGLSAIVPGLGRWYAGDWKNALVSFMFVGINGFQSYTSFKKNGIKSTGGWIFGSLATGFYLGNIYGSSWTAKRKNQQKWDKYVKKLDHLFYHYPF